MHTCVNQKAHPIASNASYVKGCRSSTSFPRWVRKEFRCRDCDTRKETGTEKSMAFSVEGTRPSWRETRKSQHLRNRAIIINLRVNQSHMPLPAMPRTLKDVEVPPPTSDISTTRTVVAAAKREKTSSRRPAKMPGACTFNMVMVQRHRTSGGRQRQGPAVVRGSTCSAVLRSHLLIDVRYKSVQESNTSRIALLQLLRSVVSPARKSCPGRGREEEQGRLQKPSIL